MTEELEKIAVSKAIEVLKDCSTKHGLYASGGKRGYTQVWSRDSNFSMIGASFHTNEFEAVFRQSLMTLAAKQSKNGQIPNAVDFIGSIDKPATYATIDSSLWFILGHYFYKKKFGKKLWKQHKRNIENAITWVRFQDAGEDLMPEQLPTSDWQDCFPHKYGHAISTQALYYASLRALQEKKLKKYVENVYSHLWDGSLGYFLPWHWKDHGKEFQEKETWFDTLGNLLAIVFGLANKNQAKSIIDFINYNGIARPYPIRVIFPVIKIGSKEWKDYFEASEAREPHRYLNGGIWPFAGGLYVAALVELKQFDKAKVELEMLARANKLGVKSEWDFNEWINPVSMKAAGGYHQAWSAGGYLLAYECVKQKKNLLKI